MTTHRFILFPGPAMWRFCAADDAKSALIDVALAPDAAADDVAKAVAVALRSAGYDGDGVLLAMPSAWCLSASVPTKGLPTRNRHQALAYRFEDKLPLAAEDVIADFLPFDSSGDETFGVCAQKASFAPLVEALESNGVAVAMICPAALLALQKMCDMRSPGPVSADAIVWPSEQVSALELFIFRDNRLRAWYVLPDEPRDVLLHLALEFRSRQVAAERKRSIVAINVRAEIASAVSAHAGLQLVSGFDGPAPNPMITSASIAGEILAGKIKPWINLRRDDLAEREPFRQIRIPLNCAAAAVVLFLLCLFGGMLWRASRYDQLTTHYQQEQMAVFRQAFPNVAVPLDVHSRLIAEERGLHGLSGDASAPATRETGLVTLRDLLTHLPRGDELRYRVLELRLDPSRFTLEGQAAAHGDADVIVAALRRGGAFTVEPPRTEQMGGDDTPGNGAEKAEPDRKGVSFTISGAIAPESAAIRRRAR